MPIIDDRTALAGSSPDDLVVQMNDVRNYLRIASSTVKVLAQHPDADGSSSYAAYVRHVADALDRAIRLGHRSAYEGAGPFEIRLALEEFVPLLTYAGGPDVRIHLRVGLIPRVSWSRTAFQNSILSLALNARDAMPNGGNLTISAVLAYGPEAPEIELTVSDTGMGMPPEVLLLALNTGYTTKALDDGAGNGLAVVQAFVHRVGGRLSLESRERVGTSVRLRLPLP